MILFLLLAGCHPVTCGVLECDGLLLCSQVYGERGEAAYWVEGPGLVSECAGADCEAAVQEVACAMSCAACNE